MTKLSERISSFFGRSRGATGASAADTHRNLDKRLVLQFSGKRIPTSKQLKHLPRFLSPKEKRVIAILGAVIALALFAYGAKMWNEHMMPAPASGGDYVEASVGSPHYVNPVLAANNDADQDLMKLVFSGLLKTTPKGELVPDLAESYTLSDDGKTYTFKLRSGVQWHDNTPFTAKDVVATINLIKDPSFKSPLASQFKGVTVTSSDDQTVVFTLSEPFAPFLSMLTVGIVPEHLWQTIKPENAARAELNLKPIGTGPFKFKSFAKDKQGAILSYTLARNDKYYGDVAHLSSITFKYFSDFGSAHDALVDRRVDGMSFLPLEYRDAAQKQRNIRLTTLRLPQYTGVFFNQNKNAALKSKAVRQALATAIDRESILKEALGDNGVMVWSPILAGFVGFNPDVKKYSFDAAAAADMLDKEGWKLDSTDGIRKLTTYETKTVKKTTTKTAVQTPLAITLTTVEAKENMAVADIIKRNWDALGIQTTLNIVPGSKIQKDVIRPREYEALLYGEIIGTDPDPYPFWHSSQNSASGLNLAVYSNRRVDEILEKARVSADNAEREKMYREFQDILAEEVPAILLYSPTYTYAIGRKLQGVEAGTIFMPSDRFDDVTSWYVNTKRIWK